MAGRAQLKFVMTECLKTQIRLTGLIFIITKKQYYGAKHCLHIVCVESNYNLFLSLHKRMQHITGFMVSLNNKWASSWDYDTFRPP